MFGAWGAFSLCPCCGWVTGAPCDQWVTCSALRLPVAAGGLGHVSLQVGAARSLATLAVRVFAAAAAREFSGGPAQEDSVTEWLR